MEDIPPKIGWLHLITPSYITEDRICKLIIVFLNCRQNSPCLETSTFSPPSHSTYVTQFLRVYYSPSHIYVTQVVTFLQITIFQDVVYVQRLFEYYVILP